MKRMFDQFSRLVNRAGRASAIALLVALAAPNLPAQQQYQGFCAAVKLEILQELTLERIGFLATREAMGFPLLNNETPR